jgi:hypothetical protein
MVAEKITATLCLTLDCCSRSMENFLRIGIRRPGDQRRRAERGDSIQVTTIRELKLLSDISCDRFKNLACAFIPSRDWRA